MASIDTLIFDLDDTLYDSKEVYHQGLVNAFERSKEWNMAEDFDSFQEMYNLARKQAKDLGVVGGSSHSRLLYFKRLCENFYDYSAPKQTLALDKAYSDAYKEIDFSSSRLLLKKFKEKYNIVILTNHILESQLHKLEQLDPNGEFIFRMFSSEELGAEKPAASCYENLLKQINREPEQCVMIGDSLSADVTGAKNIGMKCFWLNPEAQSVGELVTVISKLEQLEDYL